jgi:hypothetical protein
MGLIEYLLKSYPAFYAWLKLTPNILQSACIFIFNNGGDHRGREGIERRGIPLLRF